jgi:hypothetical protein
MRILLATLLLAATAHAEPVTVELSASGSRDLEMIAAVEGTTPEAWLSDRVDRIIARNIGSVRVRIIEALKAQIANPLTTEQLFQAWKTGRIPTPYPSATPRPTETATRTATAGPSPTPTRTPPGQSGK